MIFPIPCCDVTSVILGPTFVMPCMIPFYDATSVILEMLHLYSLILCIFYLFKSICILLLIDLVNKLF